MKRTCFFILIICSIAVNAQQVNADYQSFRNSILEGYQEYRQDVLDNYSTYLAGIWQEFQLFNGEKRNKQPKPHAVPKVEDTPEVKKPQSLPTPNVKPDSEPSKENQQPIIVSPKAPSTPKKPIVATPKFDFTFYGVHLKGTVINTHSVSSMESTAIATVWEKYQQNEYQDVIQTLSAISISYGLNDWFTFDLVRRYVDCLLKKGTSADRIVLQHFMLTHLGFDVRLARTNQQLILLVPCKQQVYERNFIVLDNEKLYVFTDNLSPQTERSRAIYTCQLPDNIDKGKQIDLTFNKYPLNLTNGEYKDCILTDGRIRIQVTINKGMMEMLRHYPQMDVPHYASSKISPRLHKSIIEQIRPQLAGMTQKDAANALLHFVQYAFAYSTDGEQHGYEKPYFIEENFYYPQNDCEDRSILFAFLINNLLGLDTHLIQYPGHECTAVCFTDKSITGDSYFYKDKTYTICDPTYIGAPVGMCMPAFINSKPVIELWY